MTDTAIEIKDLRFSYGRRKILIGVNRLLFSECDNMMAQHNREDKSNV